MESRKLHAAILSSPGMGHLVPVLELGKHLATNRGLEVTILVVATHSSPAESQLLDPSTAPKHLHILRLPPVDISTVVNPDIKVVSQLAIIMREARPAIRSVLSSMKQRAAMFIVDLFGNEAFGIDDEFHMSKYLFVTSTAWFTALTLYCHVLDKEVEGQYVDHKEPLRLPGCKPVRPEDLVDPMLDRNCQQYYEYLRVGVEYSMCDGILINTWEDLERTSIKALQADETLRSVVKVPVYPVGPLTKPLEPAGPKSELLEWLDKPPSESVIYVSLGSGGTLSAEQTTELAWGLELSRQRFVWVLRPPKEDHADASFFTSGSGPDGTPEFLPDGFLTRTHKAGVVVPLWGPQLEILSHPSVGGNRITLWVELDFGESKQWCANDCMATLCRAKIECNHAGGGARSRRQGEGVANEEGGEEGRDRGDGENCNGVQAWEEGDEGESEGTTKKWQECAEQRWVVLQVNMRRDKRM
ncbi:hypothetical protein CsSME_00003880 [Camellia sinensis var. sinensis]